MPNHAAAIALTKELAVLPPNGGAQGVPLPGTEREGRSPIYRHHLFTDKPLMTCLDPDVLTLHDLFAAAVDNFGKYKCLGERKWLPATQTFEDKFTWLTYAQVAERRKNVGAGLIAIKNQLGMPASEKGVALWSQNRPEWQLVDLGCMSQGHYTVSLYENFGPNAVEYILTHAELSMVATSITHLPMLLQLAPRLPRLKLIISLDDLASGEVAANTKGALLGELAAAHGIKLVSLAELEKLGAESGRAMNPVAADDLYTINYTSGTTGPPKGVLLTHGNCISSNGATRIAAGSEAGPQDTSLSYMPLAHMLQRLAEHGMFAVGSSIGYFHGEMLELLDDIKLLKPTSFVSVPRLFNRFNSALTTATVEAEGFRGNLSRRVIDAKTASMKLPIGEAYHTHWLYDRFWTPKVRAALGLQNVRLLGSGSAPIDPQVQTFLSAALSARFLQGYGMTETAGVVSAQLAGDYSTGNCGPPAPNVEMCLESVPDMGYGVHDKPYGRGELLLRGPSIFQGYFKNDEENKKVLDADGWFHTGDVAQFDDKGRVCIIDRKKNIVKLSQGEYVAPERLENVYTANCSLIANAFVHGDSTESTLVGVFGVNPETFAPWASKLTGLKIADTDVAAVQDAVNRADVKTEFLKVLDAVGRKNKFNGYERVQNILLAVEPFTVENELLTPTLKLKRPQAAKAFNKQIKQMYKEIKAKRPERALL